MADRLEAETFAANHIVHRRRGRHAGRSEESNSNYRNLSKTDNINVGRRRRGAATPRVTRDSDFGQSAREISRPHAERPVAEGGIPG